MLIRLQAIFTFLFFLLLSTAIFAGAWTQKRGDVLNILSLHQYRSDQYRTPGGSLQNSPTYRKKEIDEYVELGATDRLTLGFYFSGISAHTTAQGTQNGMNDNQIFARYRVWKNASSVFAIEGYVDRLGQAAQFNVPPQNTKYNTSEQILYGTSGKLQDYHWFADGMLGLVQRYGLKGQALLNLEAGLKTNDETVWLFLQDYNTFSLSRPGSPQNASYNLITLAPSVLFWMNPSFAIQTGFSDDVYGNNVGQGASIFVACWLKV